MTSLIIDARDVDRDWLCSTLQAWLFAPGQEWCILWDDKAKEPVPRLDTGHSIERWEA